MTKFKGTQGKWIFDDINMKIKGSGDFDGMTVIANVSPKMDYSRGMTTQSYNALLISKAPEMLYLLNDLLHDKGLNEVSVREIKLLIKEATEI